MSLRINYIHVELDTTRGEVFVETAMQLEEYGFGIHCFNKWNPREYYDIDFCKGVIPMPNPNILCVGTLNAEDFSDELVQYIRKNHHKNGGCILEYKIDES